MNKPSSRLISDARGITLMTVYDVLEKGAFANLSLDKHLQLSKLSAEDRHLATEITNGTIRMLKHLDWVLNAFLPRPIADQNPWLRNILRISVYQMLFMDRIPDYAVVSSSVDLARSKVGSKLSGVVNGVLRNLARNRDTITYPQPIDSALYLSVYYSQPEWLVRLWLKDYGLESVRNMLAYLNQRPLVTLRNNKLTGSRGNLQEQLRAEGVNSTISPRTPWSLIVTDMNASLGSLEAYRRGRFYIQNEGSMLAAAVLDPQPGEHIIDLCSGVGGKATFMAELMDDLGQIDALELYGHKLALLAENCSRLKITIVHGHQQDIIQLSPNRFLAAGVLLDAPCSGLGVLNRRADMRWRRTEEQMEHLPELQGDLLQNAAAMVLPGGRLVYTTCTINHRENEDIVLNFLHNHDEFHLESFSPQLQHFPLDEMDRNQASQGMVCLLPGKYQTDGMFFARMRRIEQGQYGNEA